MGMPHARSRLSAALACALLLGVRPVHASPLLDLTGDTTSMGGLQAGTVPGGSGAAYFNPALLLEVDPRLSIGFMVLSQQISVSLDGRPGPEFAVPSNIANAGHANGDRFDNYPIPTNLLQHGRPASSLQGFLAARPRQGAGSGQQTITYEVVGLVVKLFNQHLAIGFHGLVPNGQFTKLRAFFNDEREQYFSNSLQPELYSDRMTALSLGLGVGYQLTDALSLGIGATISLAANVGAPTYVVDTGNLGKILIDIDAGVNVSVSPHFGLDYKVSDALRLTATAHAPVRVDLGTSFKFLLANGVEQQSGVSLVHDYTPWQFGLGASYELVRAPGQTLSLAATLLYVRWSQYLDRHGENPSGAYTWSDTISPTLGARYRWQKLSSFLDLAYTPSPVPSQTGRTNYVDNDRLSGNVGAEYRVRCWGTELGVGAQFQVHRLMERHQTKIPTPTRPDGTNIAPQLVKDEVPDDAQLSGVPLAGASGLQTNNPGWPGFGSQGWILAGTVYLEAMF
jgi:long-chain fatty acid transport protein